MAAKAKQPAAETFSYKGKNVSIVQKNKTAAITIDRKKFQVKLMDMEGGAKWTCKDTYLHRSSPKDAAKDIVDNWYLINK